MLTHFVNGLNNLPNWDFDKAFIWITLFPVAGIYGNGTDK